MKVRRGDVVLVNYLFSDRTASKVRPCLVVQNDSNNRRFDDTIVVAISSNIARAITERTQLLIKIGTSEGANQDYFSIQRCSAEIWLPSTLNSLCEKLDRCPLPLWKASINA